MRVDSRGSGKQMQWLLLPFALVSLYMFYKYQQPSTSEGYEREAGTSQATQDLTTPVIPPKRLASPFVPVQTPEREVDDTPDQDPNSYLVKLHPEICGSSMRAGGRRDGGWNVCLPLSKPCVVYSYGIKDDFSFDGYMAKKELCEVHGFDPSPYGLPSKPRYNAAGGVYHDVGLGGTDGTFAPGTVPFLWPGLGYLRESNTAPWVLETIPTTMKKNNHQHVQVLKIDVEGAEWFVIDQLLSTSWDQLLVELHFPPDEYDIQRKMDGFVVHRKAEKTMNRLEWLRKLGTIAKLWKWNFNVQDKHCVEAYFLRNK